MEFVPLLVMTALIKKTVDLLRYATNQDWNGILTQLVAWTVGIGLTFVVADSDFGAGIAVNGHALSALNTWSIVLTGLVVGSSASFAWDIMKAVDNTTSSAPPPLVSVVRNRPAAA